MNSKVVGSDSERSTASRERRCKLCHEVINADAKLCPHCQSYQSRFRNLLVFTAQVLAVVSVIGSAIVFTITAWPELRKQIEWQDDIRLMRVSLVEGIDGVNVGDGSVFVRQVEFEGFGGPNDPKPRRIVEWVRRSIAPNDSFSREFSRKGGDVVDDMTEAEWRDAVAQARAPDHEEECIVVQIVASDEPDLAMYRRALGEKLRTFDVKGTIYYFSIEQQKNLAKKFAATGFLLRREHCKPTLNTPR